MDDETLKALVGSIKKWTAIARGEGVDRGAQNCPLCRKFRDGFCWGCPVAKAACAACIGSPYVGWLQHQTTEHHVPYGQLRRSVCPKCREAALREVWYLCTLLPGEEVDDA